MSLKTAIEFFLGKPLPPKSSNRKWKKCLPQKKVYSNGDRTVYLDKNLQVIRIVDRIALEDGTISLQQVHSNYKGRPCRIESDGIYMAMTCLDGNTPIFDYYCPILLFKKK